MTNSHLLYNAVLQFFMPPGNGRLVLFAALNKALYLSSIGSMAGISPLL